MKKLTIICSLLLTVTLFSQESTTRMNRATKLRKVIGSSKSAIDQNQRTANSFTSTASGGGTVNGSTSDNLSVSLSGGVNYAVPIDVPPGLNGVQPEIALVYDSQAGNGLAGWGWNISGVSVITRIPSTLFHDNGNDGVDFDLYDRFSMDGQRLIIKTGTYGGDGSVYQTEQFSNLKIVSHGSHPETGVQGPASFKVFYPDGSIGYYGNSSNSRTHTDYAITYWENPQGIRVNYYYNKLDNALSIQRITYGSRGSSTPINELEFLYGNRARPEQSYINGVSFKRKKILEEIKVKGSNSVGYRNYIINHDQTSLGYERVVSIQEKTGDNSLSRSAISFNYGNSTHSVNADEGNAPNLSVSNIEQRNAEVVSLDILGNGKMDFIVYPKTGPDTKKKFWVFTDIQDGFNYSNAIDEGTFLNIFPVSWLDDQNSLSTKQGLTLVQNSGNIQVNFKVMAYENLLNPMEIKYVKSWTPPTYTSESSCTISTNYRIPQHYLSGDFDGDGLSDVMAIGKLYNESTCATCGDGGGGNPLERNIDSTSKENLGENNLSNSKSTSNVSRSSGDCCCETTIANTSRVNFIKLDRRLTSNFASDVGQLLGMHSNTDQFFTADVNGDGKTDILRFKNGEVQVYSLNNSNTSLSLIWTTTDSRIDLDYPFLLGDYNGDGKVDFMVPTGNNTTTFATFLSTGNSFSDHQKVEPFQYKEIDYNGQGTLYGYNLVPVDINGDGRTDILDYRTTTYNGNSNGTQTLAVYKNTKTTDTNVHPKFVKIGPTESATGNLKHFPIPIFLTNDKPNNNLDFAAISDKWVTTFSFSKDHREDMELQTITNNGISTAIAYEQVNEFYDNGLPGTGPAYKESSGQVYPFINVNVAPSFKVVSELTQTGAGLTRRQKFYYEGAISHATGLGFVGFEILKRSNWWGTGVDALWTITKNDPMLRGRAIEEIVANVDDTNPSNYMTKTNYFYDYHLIANPGSPIVPYVQPTYDLDYSIPGPLTRTAEQSIILSEGFYANGSNGDFLAEIFPPSEQPGDTGYAGAVDIILERVETDNMLTGVFTTETYAYDQYNNPLSKTTTFPGGNRSSNYQYYNNETATNNTYHIGRIKSMSETVTLNGNTFSTEEQYSYNNNLVTQIKKKGNGTNWLVESFSHDANGNVLTKTLSGTDVPTRTEEFEYSTTYGGRFLTKSTDVEGLETVFTYYSASGNLHTTTNPYNLATELEYDKWDRILKEKDFLNHFTNHSYVVLKGGGLKSTVNYPTGAKNETLYNAFGWVTRKGSLSLGNQWIYKSYEYDVSGRVKRESEPHNGSPNQWNSIAYEVYGRPTSQTLFTGRTINYSYSNLSTTVNDGVKSVTTTVDALGNTVQLQDPGGTIDYTYFANGVMKTADYSSHIITVGIDGWGRKTSLNDPSAGTYTYKYNDYGELEEETTPKGTTTYVYDNFGKVTSKTMTGELTDHSLTYVYDTTTKLLKTINGLDNTNSARAYTYQYTYDGYQRPDKTTENTGEAVFESTSTYDGYGRVWKETYTSTLTGGASKTLTTRNVYDTSGLLKEIWNDGTPDKLWEIDDINARGQSLKVTLGNGIEKNKTYDAYGFLTKIEDKESGTNPTVALHTEYDFNHQRGILDSRDNHGFSWQETFTHDNLDRLTTISGSITHSMAYENSGASRGNIQNNSSLGDYTYGNSGKKYQLTEIDPNGAGDTHFQQHPTQTISYNAFKKPIDIHQAGHGRVSFEYGPMMNRSTAYYGGEDANKTARRYKKHYSAIIPVEIVEDTQASTTKIVTYIAGDAYTAPIVHIKTTGTGALDEYHYLHRDYLGSILAITDADGDLVEERHFGAWGTVDQFLDSGSGTTFGHGSLLGRGYTGHEHFFEVGLIHMNGRMYNAMLGRFLSPDNFVQDPFNTQNYNRYGYVLNNPLVTADPSGEFFWFAVAIGALVGGVSQAIQPGANFGSILGGALIGAAAGAVGAGVGNVIGGGSFFGSKIATSIGFGQGFASGFAGGFAGGFVGGAGNSWLNGDSFGRGLLGGLKAGGIGGVAGGLINGITSGFRSLKQNGNFWNGKGATIDYTVPSQEVTSVEVGDGLEYSSEYAQKFSDANFGEVEAVDNLIADGSTPAKGYTKVGDRVYSNAYGEEVRGTAVHLGNREYDVYLYKAAFTSKEQLYLTIGHEYQHIGYDFARLGNRPFSEHYGIRRWEYFQAKEWGWQVRPNYDKWMTVYKYWNPAYHHENFSSSFFGIIKNRPVLPK